MSPRILLAQQHCDEFEEWMGLHPMLQRKILHVHSGDTSYTSTTNSRGQFVNGIVSNTDIIN